MDAFARSLVEDVRDRSVLDLRAALRLEGVGPTTERWKAALSASASSQEFASAIVPDIIDQVLANLLDAIDNQLLPLEFVDESTGTRLQLGASGELAGAYLADDGWRKVFGATP